MTQPPIMWQVAAVVVGVSLGLLQATFNIFGANYKKGDCFKLVTDVNITNYTVVDLIDSKYIVSRVFARDGDIYVISDQPIVLTKRFVHVVASSRKINCGTLE